MAWGSFTCAIGSTRDRHAFSSDPRGARHSLHNPRQTRIEPKHSAVRKQRPLNVSVRTTVPLRLLIWLLNKLIVVTSVVCFKGSFHLVMPVVCYQDRFNLITLVQCFLNIFNTGMLILRFRDDFIVDTQVMSLLDNFNTATLVICYRTILMWSRWSYFTRTIFCI